MNETMILVWLMGWWITLGWVTGCGLQRKDGFGSWLANVAITLIVWPFVLGLQIHDATK